MRNIRNRLKELSKSFPPGEDNNPYPQHLRAAALGRLSYEDLVVMSSLAKAEEQSPTIPWNAQELRVVEKYKAALALEAQR